MRVRTVAFEFSIIGFEYSFAGVALRLTLLPDATGGSWRLVRGALL
jgi:hypothetical protein